jgi:hypothetical protein
VADRLEAAGGEGAPPPAVHRAHRQLGAAVGDGIAALIAIRSFLQRHSDMRTVDINA